MGLHRIESKSLDSSDKVADVQFMPHDCLLDVIVKSLHSRM
jgi:hypothetical protein